MESMSHIPPGYRFHPTDEELVDYYLKKKVAFPSLQVDVIKDVDLYKIEPWDLQELCGRGTGEEREWYFYSHKDKKYPTGTRTNRATGSGFWKATGRDKAIYSKQELVGMRKTLVFYKGRAPNGQKSDWIMHEYRLETDENGPPHEEGWVVCRAFKKKLTINYNNNNNNSRTMMIGSSSNQESNWFGQHMDVNNGNNYYHLPDLESPRMFQGSSSSLLSSHHHHTNHHHNNHHDHNDDVYGTLLNTINPIVSHGDHMVMMNNHHQQSNVLQLDDDNNNDNDNHDNDDDHGNDHDQVMDWQTLDKFVASQLIMNQGDEEDQVRKDLSTSSQNQTYQNLCEEQQRMVSMNVSSSSSPSSFYSWSQNTHT